MTRSNQRRAHTPSAQCAALLSSLQPQDAINMAVTPEQLAKAHVPLNLATWYHCVAKRITKPTLIDAVRLAQVRSMVCAAGLVAS